jgi:hypothetical protein
MAILAAPALQAFSNGTASFPSFDATDEAILSHIQQTLETLYHPVGTCKMGTDTMAVTDHTLKVKKVKGLRVVDVSSPTQPVLKGKYYTTGRTKSVAVRGQYFYVADGEDGLDVLQFWEAQPTMLEIFFLDLMSGFLQPTQTPHKEHFFLFILPSWMLPTNKLT